MIDTDFDPTLDETDMKAWLLRNGYDGLYNELGDPHCGCTLRDFRPCEYDPEHGCVPAHAHGDWLYPGRCNGQCEGFQLEKDDPYREIMEDLE